MKRTHLISVVIAMLLVLPFAIVSCSNSENGVLASTAVSSVEIVTPTTTPTQTPTPTPTIMPTPSPIPAPTQYVEDDLVIAPDISGLSKEIQDGKIVYLAAAGNEYDLVEGAFAGIYVRNILVEEKQVGGVSLKPNIVKVLLANALTKIPNGEDKMKIILPLDITELVQEDSININNCEINFQSKDTNESFYYQQVVVTFSKSIMILNPIVNSITYNNTPQITSDLQLVKKDKSSILMESNNTAGLTPVSILGKSKIDPELAMEEFWYFFDVIDRSEIDKLTFEKKYIPGEEINVHANSMLLVCYNYYVPGGEDSFISTFDLLQTEDGTIIFTYPQQASDIIPTH